MTQDNSYSELMLFACFKAKPGIYFGSKSLMSLRDQLFGMGYAFGVCGKPDHLKYFREFIKWYNDEVVRDKNGYACWWNYMLYKSGNSDWHAFDMFFREFEDWLSKAHGLKLPEAQWK